MSACPPLTLAQLAASRTKGIIYRLIEKLEKDLAVVGKAGAIYVQNWLVESTWSYVLAI